MSGIARDLRAFVSASLSRPQPCFSRGVPDHDAVLQTSRRVATLPEGCITCDRLCVGERRFLIEASESIHHLMPGQRFPLKALYPPFVVCRPPYGALLFHPCGEGSVELLAPARSVHASTASRTVRLGVVPPMPIATSEAHSLQTAGGSL